MGGIGHGILGVGITELSRQEEQQPSFASDSVDLDGQDVHDHIKKSEGRDKVLAVVSNMFIRLLDVDDDFVKVLLQRLSASSSAQQVRKFQASSARCTCCLLAADTQAFVSSPRVSEFSCPMNKKLWELRNDDGGTSEGVQLFGRLIPEMMKAVSLT
eukprot:591840-Hanusia_phi.AAC.1